MTDGHGYFINGTAFFNNRKTALTVEMRDAALARVQRKASLGN